MVWTDTHAVSRHPPLDGSFGSGPSQAAPEGRAGFRVAVCGAPAPMRGGPLSREALKHCAKCEAVNEVTETEVLNACRKGG